MSGGLALDAPLYLNVASALGANRTLKKPFDLPTLLTAIKDVLADQAILGLAQNNLPSRIP